MSNLNESINPQLGEFFLRTVGPSPSSSEGFSDYYNDNNFIGGGVDNRIINSQRCSVLQGSTNFIDRKYNCHVIGDYMGRESYSTQQDENFSPWSELQDNTLNIGCYNGTHSWGPIFAHRGLRVEYDALFGGRNELRLGSTIHSEYQPVGFLPDEDWDGNDVGFIDFDPGFDITPGRTSAGIFTTPELDKDPPTAKHSWHVRIHNGFNKTDQGGTDDRKKLFIVSPPGADYSPSLNVEGDVIAFHSSDERLKDNISQLNQCLPKILELKPVSFEWNNKQNTYKGNDIGLLAQEVNKIAPEIVTKRKDGYLAMKYEKIIPLLVGAIQDQQKIIEEMKQEINELKDINRS